MNYSRSCSICGGNDFTYNEVLWSELIDDWELEPHEIEYINRQQGLVCIECGNNLRSIALANAVLTSWCYKGTLIQFADSEIGKNLKILEINEAGGLTPFFQKFSYHQLVKYPEYDMNNLAIETGIFDLVVHSDTLEHVKNPMVGLAECRRVLKPIGRCIFTVPLVVGRLTRSRIGLKNSYHGNSNESDGDFLVRTEFGCDAWKFVLESGFSSIAIHCVDYPAGLAFEARI